MGRLLDINLRAGTAAAWTTANPTLHAGEPGYETDTGKLKIGNGATAWNGLAYVTDVVPQKTSPWFGAGSDGNVTLSSLTNLSQDMYYNNLTINPGVILHPNNCKIFVAGTLTLNGSIDSSGDPGTAAGGAGSAWTANGTIGKGFVGGAGGTAAGSAGGGQGFDQSAAAGAGGAGSGGAGGAAGSFGAPALVRGSANWGQNFVNALLGQTLQSGASTIVESGGAGGGGGGGDGTAGGGGGGGGSAVFVAAKTLAGAGTITAAGGAGGSPAAGNRGGGGGGGGGSITLVTSSAANPYTMNVAGGAAGAKSGTGVNGTAGSNGRIFQYLGV